MSNFATSQDYPAGTTPVIVATPAYTTSATGNPTYGTTTAGQPGYSSGTSTANQAGTKAQQGLHNAKASVNSNVDSAKASLNNNVDNAKASLNSAAEQIKAHPAVKQAKDNVNQYMAQLDRHLSRYPILNQMEANTKIPKAYGAVASAALFLSMIFVNRLALPVSNIVGWAAPAYFSYRAIESPGHSDDIQWLTYWVVFGFLTFLESIALPVVLYYVPYYFPMKTAFILWLQLPQFRGAHTFHHSVIRPVVQNFRQKKGEYQQNYSTGNQYTAGGNQYATGGQYASNSPYTTTTSSTTTYPTTVADHEKVL